MESTVYAIYFAGFYFREFRESGAIANSTTRENKFTVLSMIALLLDREFNHSRKCLEVQIREKLDSRNIWRIQYSVVHTSRCHYRILMSITVSTCKPTNTHTHTHTHTHIHMQIHMCTRIAILKDNCNLFWLCFLRHTDSVHVQTCIL